MLSLWSCPAIGDPSLPKPGRFLVRGRSRRFQFELGSWQIDTTVHNASPPEVENPGSGVAGPDHLSFEPSQMFRQIGFNFENHGMRQTSVANIALASKLLTPPPLGSVYI
jgi:hypothetical protein